MKNYFHRMFNKKTWIGIGLWISLTVLTMLQSSLSAVSQPIVKLFDYPYRLWHSIAPIKTDTHVPNPAWEWLYIFVSLWIVYFVIISIYQLFQKNEPPTNILCEKEIGKLIHKMETKPENVIDDDILDVLKAYERGFQKLFNITNRRNLLCVWVAPDKSYGNTGYTNNWVAMCTDKTDPQHYIEIIQTGVFNKRRTAFYMTDLTSYETDAKEFAFFKNIGEFKFGVALLFMEEGKLTEKTKRHFEVSSALIHYLSHMDKVTGIVV